MYTANLRKVGGSVMLALPPVLLNLLRLKAGETVAIEVDNGRLILAPNPHRRYSMAELLAASDYSDRPPVEERDWVDSPAVGGELI